MRITGGKYNSRRITAPCCDNIRPTLSKTRQGIFNALLSMTESNNKIFLDMFAGSGIMGLEALSRGFNVILFEKDVKTALAIRQNFKSLNLTPELYTGDSLKLALRLKKRPDIIFLDPPYEAGLYDKSLEVIFNCGILANDGIVIAEHPVKQQVKNDNFQLIKAKTYGNKQISFFKINQAE